MRLVVRTNKTTKIDGILLAHESNDLFPDFKDKTIACILCEFIEITLYVKFKVVSDHQACFVDDSFHIALLCQLAD